MRIRTRTSHARWIGQLGAAVVVAPLALAALGLLFERAGRKLDAKRHPPRGLLLSRGGRYLHVLQEGSGRPSVVFEAGLAATSLSWARVQPLVASFSSATSYDRAGLGWSSPVAARQSLPDMLEDLRGVVGWTGGGEPVVLVGHSFGALLVLAFADRYPDRVAGLVLIDPVSLAGWSACSADDQHRLNVGAGLSRRGAWLAQFGVVRAVLLFLLHGGTRVSRLIGRHAAGRGATTLERLTGEVSKLPQELWPTIAAHWSRPESFRAMANTLQSLPEYAADAGYPTLPAELPVAILSAASATQNELRERDGWLAHQLEAVHTILPLTGHWLHLERPEEVAAAVEWCQLRARLREQEVST